MSGDRRKGSRAVRARPGTIARLGTAGHVFATTPQAIAAARDHLHHTGILTIGGVPTPAADDLQPAREP
ncbi:hypothetical protein ABZ897_35500 [Nonomuraea sp. NPDC046802]|uniref:hypothetical protein n=1 Tax=Nonomuraea sp. NPDC046802 TaxID=3154919 RepID=UPI00340B93BC